MRKDAATAVDAQPITHWLLTTPLITLTTSIKWIGKECGKYKFHKTLTCCFFQLSASRSYSSPPLQLFALSYPIKDTHLHQGWGASGAPRCPWGLSSPKHHTEKSTRFDHNISHFSDRPSMQVKNPGVHQTPDIHPGPKVLLMAKPQIGDFSLLTHRF